MPLRVVLSPVLDLHEILPFYLLNVNVREDHEMSYSYQSYDVEKSHNMSCSYPSDGPYNIIVDVFPFDALSSLLEEFYMEVYSPPHDAAEFYERKSHAVVDSKYCCIHNSSLPEF